MEDSFENAALPSRWQRFTKHWWKFWDRLGFGPLERGERYADPDCDPNA